MTSPAPREGIGNPPEGCTCLLNHYVINRIGPDLGKRHWAIQIADKRCPVHGRAVKGNT